MVKPAERRQSARLSHSEDSRVRERAVAGLGALLLIYYTRDQLHAREGAFALPPDEWSTS